MNWVLEGVEEGFCHGVVPAIPFEAHAQDAAMPFQFSSEIVAGELNSPVAEDQKAERRPPSRKGLMKSPDGRMSFERIAQVPPNYNAREQVDKHREIMPFPADLEIGNIYALSVVGDGYREFSIEQVGSNRFGMFRIRRHDESVRGLAAQSKLPHVPSNPLPTHMPEICLGMHISSDHGTAGTS